MRVDNKAPRADRKAYRAKRIAEITVTVVRADGTKLIFDGDEESQKRLDRFSRGARARGKIEIPWTMADNSTAMVTPDELEEAMLLAGEAQGLLWFV